MTISHLRSIGCCAAAVFGAWACMPDLDILKAEYVEGSGGTAGWAGFAQSGTGDGPGTGGTSSGKTGSGGDSGAGDGGTESGGKGGGSGKGGSGGSMAGTQSTSGDGGDGGEPPEPPDSCENRHRDSDESDTDCGGESDCERCDNDRRCAHGSDCVSDFCKNQRCAEPTCDDGYKNRDETETDCGGTHCEACVERCEEGDDCSSGVCENQICQPPTCSDGVRNQDESDRDCGGVCTADSPCRIDDLCNGASDCGSYVCSDGHCVADIAILEEDMIDDFEDRNLTIGTAGGRIGSWYPYGDGSGTISAAEVTTIPGKRGTASLAALHTKGSGFLSWGSGMGTDLSNAGGSQASKRPYDASAYTGVTFWARAEVSTLVTLVLPDKSTDPAGMICTTCDHHYLKDLQVGTAWQRYTVLFADLVLESGGEPIPTAFSADGVVSVQFRFRPGTDYDVWVDDLAFVR
ncbi:MAG TPA: hypothetical protein VGK73_11895 [Polyangiaceae bacterium]